MAGTMTLIAPAIAAGLAFWPSPFLAVPFYSCCRLGASKERPLECSVIGGIAPRGFSAASDFYRSSVRGDVDYVANHKVCDSRVSFCAHQS